jgi:hypothetical protein
VETLKKIARFCAADGVPRRSFVLAIVVGMIINLINQGDILMDGQPLNWVKIGLSYILPYCVATYGAVSVQMSRRAGS